VRPHPQTLPWQSRRSLHEAFPDCLSDGLIIIACATCDEVVYTIKERIVAHSFSGNCTQAYGDLSRSDLIKSGCRLFLPLRKIEIEEIIDPRNDLAIVAYADCAPQSPGIDQDRNHSLSQTDQGQHKKLSIVEDTERLYTCRPEGEKQDLNACDCTHEDGFDRIINSRIRNPQLFGHRHHGGSDQEDLNPREMVLAPLDQSGPRVRKDELAGYEKGQDE
jgi:hypothetical protein